MTLALFDLDEFEETRPVHRTNLMPGYGPWPCGIHDDTRQGDIGHAFDCWGGVCPCCGEALGRERGALFHRGADTEYCNRLVWALHALIGAVRGHRRLKASDLDLAVGLGWRFGPDGATVPPAGMVAPARWRREWGTRTSWRLWSGAGRTA